MIDAEHKGGRYASEEETGDFMHQYASYLFHRKTNLLGTSQVLAN